MEALCAMDQRQFDVCLLFNYCCLMGFRRDRARSCIARVIRDKYIETYMYSYIALRIPKRQLGIGAR